MNTDKTPKKRDRSRRNVQTQLPFNKSNYGLVGLSLAIILVGYIFLAIGPRDSFSSLTVAPILLVIGYCITLPIAIMYKKKNSK